LLGGGRTAEGFAIDSLPNYVLRVPRDYVPAPVTLQAVDDVFPGHNVGQAVAAAGRLTIHLRQEGTAIGIHPHTRSVIGEAASEELLTKNIRSAAALPQAAYDGLASELQLLQEHGLALDPNPSNVLIASNKFNVVDVARYDVARSPENQVSLSTLLNGLMDLTQPKVIPSLQGELSQIRLKAILAAQHTGLPMHLADCKWFFSVGDGEAQWNRLHHLQGIEAPSLT
jgi:hypothetical protein